MAISIDNIIDLNSDYGGTGRVILNNGGTECFWGSIKDGYRRISTITATSSTATVSFSNLSGRYSIYQLIMRDIKPVSSSDLRMQFSTDNGVTWSTTGYNYYISNVGSPANREFTYTYISLSDNLSSTPDLNNSGIVQISSLGNGSGYTSFQFSFNNGFTTSLDTVNNFIEGGGYSTAPIINAIRLFMGTGNFSSGTFSLYAIN